MRRIRSWLRTAGLVIVAVVGFVAMSAEPAGAHTALVRSEPATGSVVERAPEVVRLTFAEPVDVATFTVSIQRADGGAALVPALRSDSGAQTVVEFSVPELDPAIYGFLWETTGPDGHRVFGEIVVGIGTGSAAELAAVSFGTGADDTWTSLALGASRLAFWLVFVAAVGAWTLGTRSGLSPTVLLRVAVALAVAWLARGALVIGVVAAAHDGPWYGSIDDALGRRTGLAFLLGALGCLIAVRGARHAATWLAAGGLGLVALAATINSHPVLLSAQPFEVWVSTAHVIAASVWVGTVGWLAAGVTGWWSWRPIVDGEVTRRVSSVLLGAMAVLVVSGVRAAQLTNGLDTRGRYGAVIVVKVALVTAAAGLGAAHLWRSRAGLAPRRSSIFAEVSVLVGVVVAATLLASGVPNRIGSDRTPERDRSVLALLGDDEVPDLQACGELGVGRVACYSAQLVEIMETSGAASALAELEALGTTDPEFAADCHQYAHDLGNAATRFSPTISDALAVDGTACGSGYYHGLLEQVIGDLEDVTSLPAEIDGLCPEPTEPAVDLVAFQCVHGVGHGLMLSLDDVAEGAAVCSSYGEQWARASCFGGVQMENVMAYYAAEVVPDGSVAETTPDFSVDNPHHPCDSTPGELQPACYEQQASYFVLRSNGDATAAGSLCAAIERPVLLENCFNGLGRHLAGLVAFDGTAATEACLESAVDHLEACVLGAMRTTLNHTGDASLAPAVCDAAPAEIRTRCQGELDERLAIYDR